LLAGRTLDSHEKLISLDLNSRTFGRALSDDFNEFAHIVLNLLLACG